MESRDARLHIRLTHKELAAIKTLSDDTGLSYSQIVRASIHVNESNDSVTLVVFDRNTAPAIAREMRKWGHHYNQGVHALNAVVFYAQRGSLKPGESRQLLEKGEHQP